MGLRFSSLGLRTSNGGWKCLGHCNVISQVIVNCKELYELILPVEWDLPLVVRLHLCTNL